MNTPPVIETPHVSSPRRPELLAPAGDRDCAKAAVASGADAVYFGLATPTAFNARARAKNIPVDELPELIDWLHARDVRGYVTLNTLVFTDELEEVERMLRQIAESGADAVLVQDLGVAQLAREVCPELPIHASTQMTLTSAENIRMVASLGFKRVILARELSISEIAAIRRETDLELEVFVHGALCIAYSGQCLASAAIGGRSANRGECAQACRMPYQLIADGRAFDLGDRKYLLSPQDLAAFDLVPQLIASGVTALKIEGRLKTAEYVAHVTQHYRRAIDAATAGVSPGFSREEIQELELSFSRGFSHGWLDGPDHKKLVPGVSSAKRGVRLGEIVGFWRDRVQVKLDGPVQRGDGVVFQGDRLENAEQGGRVFEIFVDRLAVKNAEAGQIAELAFRRDSLDFSLLRVGQQIDKTDDPHLERRLRKSFSSEAPQRRAMLDVTVDAAVGRPLVIAATTESGLACRIESPDPLEAAKKHALTEDVLREQLGRLGGTNYELRGVEARIVGGPMIPLSVLGKLRHAMVEKLDGDAPARRPSRRVAAEPALPRLRARLASRGGSTAATSQTSSSQPLSTAQPMSDHASSFGSSVALHVLCRSMDQFHAMLHADVQSVTIDFRDIRECTEAVSAARHAGMPLRIATPRIMKPGESKLLRALADLQPDAALARNPAAIGFFRDAQTPVVADFSLNATNELTVQWLLDQGALRATASYDMGRDQLLNLVGAVRPDRLEVVVHQHMPMFHTEHCVFCSILSEGTNRANCGRPCVRNAVRLRDRLGMEHVLASDMGCRNTLFHAMPQSGAELVPTLLARGVRHFRVELLDGADERPEQIVSLYRELLAGRVCESEVWKRLKALNRIGPNHRSKMG
jgi:putative protease